LLVANLGVLGLAAGGLGAVVLPLAAGFAAVAAIVQRPQRGLLLLAAIAPFHGLLLILDLPSWATGWKETLVLFTLAATLVAPSEARGLPGRRLPPWTAAVAGLALIGLLSAMVVGGLQAAIGLKIGFFYALVAVIAWRCPMSAHERDLLATILMLTGFLTAVVGLVQQVMGPEQLNDMGYEYDTTIRFSGDFLRSFSTFNQPFPFAFFLTLVLLVGIPQALGEPGRLRNRAFLVVSPVLGLAVLTTFVRAAWLALGVGLLYMASRRYKSLLLLIPPAMAVLLFLPPDISERAFSAESSRERTESWMDNARLVVEHPLGAGIATTGSASEKVAEAVRDERRTYQPDNYYFKVLLELGVLGLWFLVLLLVSAFLSTRRAAIRLDGRDAALAEGVSASVLAAAAAATVATYFEIFPMDLFFWLLIGVVAACAHESP
jgi:hypothetical protein